jgi:hypothetical protein
MTKKKKVKMSVPEELEFNTSYSMPLEHSEHYWDTNRNKDPKRTGFEERLDIEIATISELLKSKNKAYGNTALNPTNIFSKLNATEALCARIDDKLARISNRGINDETEDTVDDLIGYLLLLKMSM